MHFELEMWLLVVRTHTKGISSPESTKLLMKFHFSNMKMFYVVDMLCVISFLGKQAIDLGLFCLHCNFDSSNKSM